MLNVLKMLAKRITARAPAPCQFAPAGHGVDGPVSTASAASLALVRRGRLKTGNPPGNFLAALRCGARTRVGGCCRQPAMRNGRCRPHGGLSTGPRTAAGLARSRRARLSHGGRSDPMRALPVDARGHARRVRSLIAFAKGRSAGHGVGRLISQPKTSGVQPRSSAARPSCPVGHGVHRSVSPLTATIQSDSGIRDGGHRGSRSIISDATPLAPCHPSIVLSLPSAFDLSSAGHGLHRSFSAPGRRSTNRVDLRSSAASSLFSAGHGVDRSFLGSPPSDGARPA